MQDLLAPIKEAQEDVAEAIEEKLHYLQEQQSYQAQMLKQLLEHHRIQLQVPLQVRHTVSDRATVAHFAYEGEKSFSHFTSMKGHTVHEYSTFGETNSLW